MMVDDVPTPQPRRFVRLPGRKDLAETIQRVWKNPDFSPREVNGATEFVFSVPIQLRFQEFAERDYEILFHSKNIRWVDALTLSYRKSRVQNAINTALYKVFSEAVLLLASDTSRLSEDYAEFKKNHPVEFRAAAPRVPGKQADRERGPRLANRFDVLLPRMQQLRKFVDDMQGDNANNATVLATRVGEAFQEDWCPAVVTGEAFKRLPTSQGHEIASTLGGNWAPWQLTVGVIRWEEDIRLDKQFSSKTIYRIIGQARKLSRLKPKMDSPK
jgi:hypothetical protein